MRVGDSAVDAIFWKAICSTKGIRIEFFHAERVFFEKSRFGGKLPQQMGILGSQKYWTKGTRIEARFVSSVFSIKLAFWTLPILIAFCLETLCFHD